VARVSPLGSGERTDLERVRSNNNVTATKLRSAGQESAKWGGRDGLLATKGRGGRMKRRATIWEKIQAAEGKKDFNPRAPRGWGRVRVG